MKYISMIVLTLLAFNALAKDTGQFEISKTSFKELFNKYRFASPQSVPWAGNFFPYADHGTAVRLSKEGDMSKQGRSPMEAYGLISDGTKEAEKWEAEVHGCDQYTGSTKTACRSWWGHCNGWSAAAIKETEPRSPKKFKGTEFSVAEQKAILSESWLSNYSLNAGLSDKSLKTGRWVHDHARPNDEYRSFWDVTPKSFFLIFTNYIGLMKTGVVIDRFTGDEVWNHPVVGYRFLPIRQSDVTEVQKKYWSVKLRMKMYWANDTDIPHGHLSRAFDITKTKDSESLDAISKDYDSRYLEFTLYFNSKVTVSNDGKTILTAGKMLGDGLWGHQENSHLYSYDALNHSHPDFIWIPTQAVQDTNGYGNPYIDPELVQRLVAGKESSTASKAPVVLRLAFAPSLFDGSSTTPELAKSKVLSVIRREGIKHAVYLRDIEISRNKILVVVRFPLGVNVKALTKLFEAAGMPVRLE